MTDGQTEKKLWHSSISHDQALKSASHVPRRCLNGTSHIPPITQNTATRPTLHRIRLSTLTSSYRHLANSFTFVNDATYTVCCPGISVGVDFPPLHIYQSVFREWPICYCLWLLSTRNIVTPEFIHIQPNRTLQVRIVPDPYAFSHTRFHIPIFTYLYRPSPEREIS